VNSLYNFIARFVPGTKVRAAEVNSQFDGVTAGFDATEAGINSAASSAANAAAAAAAANTLATTANNNAISAANTANNALPRAGGTMLGNIVLVGNATASLHPVSKQQFDAELALKAALASPTFTGNVAVPSPTLPTDAANKGYADGIQIALTTYVNTQIGTRAPAVDADLTGSPTADTPGVNDNSRRIANTSWVLTKIASSVAGVASFNGRTGAITLSTADVTTALGYTPVSVAGGLMAGQLILVSNLIARTALNSMEVSAYSDAAGEVVMQARSAGGATPGVLNLQKAGGSAQVAGSNIWTQATLTSLAQLSNAATLFITSAGSPVQSVFGRTGNVTMALTDITGTLGYTPVQQGTGIGQTANAVKIGWSASSKLKVTVDSTDLGNMALESWVLAQGFLTGITSGQVTGALGYTPYNASNPAGYITAASVAASYAALSGATFTGDIWTFRNVSPGTGVLYLGNSGARYLFFNGSEYILNGAAARVSGLVYGNGGGLGLGQINLQAGGSVPGSLAPGNILGIY
jgi:hypothetical protein